MYELYPILAKYGFGHIASFVWSVAIFKKTIPYILDVVFSFEAILVFIGIVDIVVCHLS